MSAAPPSLLQQRIIAAGLLSGPLLFALVVPFLLPAEGGGIGDPGLPALEWIVVALGAVMLVGVQVARPLLLRKAAEAPPEQAQPAQFMALVMPMAMLEGGMLFSCVVWLLTGHANPAMVVFAVLFARGVMLFPRGEGS